ncbi:hypothetical protein QZH41_013296 [Actinostola sp. cb2023]|nr:hypothetical protein QZH41_013296 [Actinostola sp. cb2023]
MPVMTRSCGRKEVRRRIEDATPRSRRTTVKRKKDVSDEETEKPARKKPNTSARMKKSAETPSEKNDKKLMKSKIPTRCAIQKPSTKIIIEDCTTEEKDDILTTDEDNTINSPQHETPGYKTPVAARTRSFSALKRSYQAKRLLRNMNKDCTPSHGAISLGGEGETPESKEDKIAKDKPSQVGDIDSSTCDSESNDIEMKEGHEKHIVDSREKTNEEFYKTKFHDLLLHVKNMQESFNNAQTNASKNIKAYDAFLKELEDSLVKEKAKTTTIEEELQNTKDELMVAQKELKQANNQPIVSSQEMSIQTESSNTAEPGQDASNASLQQITKFYAMLSGISLSHNEDSVDLFESYHCVYKPKGSKGKAMQFCLTYDKEMEEVEFSPINAQSPTSGEFLQKMPKYLRENIYFTTDQAPCFLSRLIQTSQKLH